MTRRATVRTAHADPEAVAAALAPDNTDEMETRVERVAHGDGTADARRVVTEIERESTSGLQATVDDTLVNLAVADDVATGARSGDAARSEGASRARDDEQTPSARTDRSDSGADATQRTTDTDNTTHE